MDTPQIGTLVMSAMHAKTVSLVVYVESSFLMLGFTMYLFCIMKLKVRRLITKT